MTKKLAIALALAVIGTAACKKKKADKPAPPQPVIADKAASPPDAGAAAPAPGVGGDVERGKYLVTAVAGCATCHTPLTPQGEPDMTRLMAGGFEMPEKFGTWRGANVTMDKKTGIGDWTDQQIITAIREGKRPDGSQLYPIMPYLRFNALSDDDAKAIVAFMRTLPPVANAVKGNTDLKMPKIPAPPPAGKPWGKDKNGEYLVTLAQCGDCHTPATAEGAPDMSKQYAGGYLWDDLPPFVGSGKLYSRNITSDKKTGIGAWSEDEIVGAFTKGKKKDGTMIGGPMLFQVMGVWANLEAEDAHDMAKYLMTIPPIDNEVPKSDFKPAPPPGGPPGGPPPAGKPTGEPKPVGKTQPPPHKVG